MQTLPRRGRHLRADAPRVAGLRLAASNCRQHERLVVQGQCLVGQLRGLQRIVDARLVQSSQRLVETLQHTRTQCDQPPSEATATSWQDYAGYLTVLIGNIMA